MMHNLSLAFGRRAEGPSERYGFPTPSALAEASEAELRDCKVGYRAKAIRSAAQWWVRRAQGLDREVLRRQPLEAASAALTEIPFIGPYSAAIVLSAGCGRHDVFQLDSFTRAILRTFYFGGATVADDQLRSFVSDRWPDAAGAVAHLLTTNTEVWAATLGHDGFRRSGARG
jgi:N-glycosylase/DNA lyase